MKALSNAAAYLAGEFTPVEWTGDQWLNDRQGKFTASRIAELCTKDRSGKAMGKTAISYIYEVLCERLGDVEENVVTKEMQYGIDNEPIAAEMLSNLYADFRYLGQYFFKYPKSDLSDFAGASPDFMLGNDVCGEIKVPYTSRKFLEYLQLETQYDLLKYNKDYYYQVQMQIACTGAKSALLVVYNPKWLIGDLQSKKLKQMQILPDNEVIAEIENAIRQGVYHLNSISQSYLLG